MLEGDVPPRQQDVPRGVHITIMQTSTPRTGPVPNSQPFKTPRPPDYTAIGTGLRTHPFVRLDEHSPRPHGHLILEHPTEARPTRIQDGLRHLGAGQGRAIHVTHYDKGVFLGDAGRKVVQKVAPLGRYLAMYRARSTFTARALRFGQLDGGLP